MKTTFIYILWDPRYNNKCYIGKSDNPDHRFEDGHLMPSYLKIKTIKNDWIKKLIKLGLKPVLEIVDEVPVNTKQEWKFWECYYIAEFKRLGFVLTNDPKCLGGEGGPRFSDFPKKRQLEISAKIKATKARNGTNNHSLETKQLMSKIAKEKGRKVPVQPSHEARMQGTIKQKATKQKKTFGKVKKLTKWLEDNISCEFYSKVDVYRKYKKSFFDGLSLVYFDKPFEEFKEKYNFKFATKDTVTSLTRNWICSNLERQKTIIELYKQCPFKTVKYSFFVSLYRTVCNVGQREQNIPKRRVVQFTKEGNQYKVWKNLLDIQRELKIPAGQIRDCCIGSQKTCHGYIWKFQTEENVL